MIEINLNKINMKYSFDEVLKDFSFDIKTGERIALIGPNGSGKTTILKLIMKEEISSSGTITIRKNRSIGYLRQIPPLEEKGVLARDVYLRGISELLNMKRELDSLELNIKSKDIKKYTNLRDQFELLGGYELNKKINKIKSVFKLNDSIMNTEYNSLSGGEKTIINLASLVLSNPDILLLDEPTNHLDIDTLEWLEEYLSNYKGTVLIISHDRYFLDKVVNKIVNINSGHEDIYFGNYSYYLKESEKRMLQEFLNYKNQQKEIKALKDAIERLKNWAEQGDNPTLFRRMHAMEKRLENIELIEKPKKKIDIPIKFNKTDRSSNTILKLNHYNLSIGDKELLNDSKMDIYYKDRLCLMGKNGSGKTTLIKSVLKGNEDIYIGNNIKLGYIPQEIRFDNENMSIYDHMRKIFVGSENELRSKLFQFYFGSDAINKKLNALSGGEKVRIKLLELILNDVNLLILDEPTNHIDIETREILENSLLEFNGTILFISHDRYFINKIASRIVRIENKKLVSYDGNYDSLKEPKVKEEKKEEDKEIKINGSNRLDLYIKDSKIEQITDKVYRIKKKSRTLYLKIYKHLSEESMRQDFLEDKFLIPNKLFYEKYNDKSYILTESIKGENLLSEYYANHKEEAINIIIEAFNNIYNVDESQCLFDETIDMKIKRIEENLNNDKKIDNEEYKKEFYNRNSMLQFLKGNKPSVENTFSIGNMSLDNIYAKDNSFVGMVNVKESGISDIYYDIVTIEESIENNYGKEYVNMFYDTLGFEKNEFKSKYYKILNYLKNN